VEQVESFSWVGQELVLPITAANIKAKNRVARIEASLAISDHGISPEPKAPLPVLNATQISGNDYGMGFKAAFAFTNETDVDLQDLRVGVVCYNKAQKIIGGGVTYPNLAPAGKTIRIDTDLTVSSKPTACKAFLNYSDM